MRFLVDECTGPRVAEWLQSQGYEVFCVYDQSRGISDTQIIEKAFAENWILITNDKDFGDKIFRDRFPHHGVILLRLANERSQNKITVLRALLENHLKQLADHFVVVTEQKIRIS